MSNYTQRYNKNRGYMKLEVWKKSIELFQYIASLLKGSNNLPYKLKNQLIDSVQSISSNISEGYCRRHLNEYIQYLYIALGSAGETLTRVIGLNTGEFIQREEFEEIDELHYEIENKLLALIRSLEEKRDRKEWVDRISETDMHYFHKDFTND